MGTASKILGFMHVGVSDHAHRGQPPMWKVILDDQIAYLRRSGLYDRSDEIYVGVNGGGEDTDLSWISGKLRLLDRSFDFNYGENETINKMIPVAKDNPGGKLWYIHTKGSTRLGGQLEINVYYWRKFMEYFIIQKHEDCIAALDEVDACGVNWYNDNFFSGNFWWATTDLIGQKPPITPGADRHRAEEFLGFTKPKPRVKCFHMASLTSFVQRALYSCPYPPERYEDP